MKLNFTTLLLSFSLMAFTQTDKIKHTIEVPSNQELNDVLWFENIGFLKLNFESPHLKGKDYRIMAMEFKNGKLVRIDTIHDTSKNKYSKKIDSNNFQIRVLAKQNDNDIKLNFNINNMQIKRNYDIVSTPNEFALKDFIGVKNKMDIEFQRPKYILSYLLPYTRDDLQMNFYCEVAESEYDPKQWGEIYNIPQYFLFQIEFD